MRKDTHGENNPHWRGGRYINYSGYNMVYNPEHHRANHNGYVREHVVLAEKVLGNLLPKKAQVHHYSEIGDNSKIIICENQNYHRLLHIRAKALETCGNANYRKCKFCQQYDDPMNMYVKQFISNGQINGWNCYHVECRREYEKKRRAANV
jgi:hypothetical protein